MLAAALEYCWSRAFQNVLLAIVSGCLASLDSVASMRMEGDV